MRKIIPLLASIILLLGVIYFATGTCYSEAGDLDTSYYGDEADTGDGGITTWQKKKETCEDGIHTEYSCLSGGIEQCTVQNCP